MLLGITAQAQSGKDTLAGMLAKESGMELYALAQPIKDIMCALFDWGEQHREGDMKEIPLTYTISPDDLENAGELYYKYGLGEYEEFHDCWEKLLDLFNINTDKGLLECVISPRESFQLFGTDWGRKLDDLMWLKVAPTENTIITDIRFDNEAEFFIKKGAKIIKVIRNSTTKVKEHISEVGILPSLVNIVVYNNTTLLDLEGIAKHLIHNKYESGVYKRLNS